MLRGYNIYICCVDTIYIYIIYVVQIPYIYGVDSDKLRRTNIFNSSLCQITEVNQMPLTVISPSSSTKFDCHKSDDVLRQTGSIL